MSKRLIILSVLVVGALISAWILNRLGKTDSKPETTVYHAPDYYMEDFTTHTMDQNGALKYELYAIYMAHYSYNDSTELLKPKMQFFRIDKPPLVVTADKGWITTNNEVVLLRGNVQLYEENNQGNRTLQIDTDKAHILTSQNYAETDEYAKIVSNNTTITGTGMRAYFNESRLEVLSDVHTKIITTR